MIEKRISFKLDPSDIFIYDNQLLKTASVNLPDNIPYDPNFLYIEVRAVSAGEYYGNNKNVDYFPEDQLNPKMKNAGFGKETFMTAHLFKNHDNKDVANAIGDVLKVTWDDEMKGVNLLVRIDRKSSPSVARGFEGGYITDVSMGCRVHHVVCSICGKNARTKDNYCIHLKNQKGKIFPDGRKVQEINMQPKFHDISVVLNGAEKIAKVMKIYKDDTRNVEKTATLSSNDMTRIALELGMSKTASFDGVDGLIKYAGFNEGATVDDLAAHDGVRSFLENYIEESNNQNISKIALEQEFEKHDDKANAFKKLATIQKISEFEKRIEGEIIRTSAKDVEDKMKQETDSNDAFHAALCLAKARNFTELDDEALDEISKKLLAISEEKRIPRFEILRSFFTVLSAKGVHLTLSEFAHLTLHVLKGLPFEGDHEVFERKIGDYRARLTEMIMADIKNQEIVPGTGLFNAENAVRRGHSPLGHQGLDKMIMALSGAAPFGVRAVVRRPMMKIASYQDGAVSPAGICGSDMTNEVIFTLETMVDECPPLVDRLKPMTAYAQDLIEIAEMEKTAAEEMSEKERHDREIAKLKRRRLLSGLAFAGGAGTDLGLNIANEMGRGNPKIKKTIKRVNYPATLLATYGLVDSNLKLKQERQKYHDSLKGTEKTAGESMPARYKKINWENDPTGEKKKIKRKLLASGALTAAGLGINLSQLALATRDMVKNTNHAKSGVSLAGTVGGGAGLLLTEKQLQKAEKLEGLPVGGAANQKRY